MKVSEALDRVGQIYVPGLAAYFEQFKPDPWLAAHEDLERVMIAGDEAMTEAAADGFLNRCTELVDRFKRDGVPPTKMDPVRDGFNLGNVGRVAAHMSRKNKDCAKCGSKEKLKIVPVQKGGTDVMLLCESCLKTRGAA